jgi:hypothetical protein
MFFLENNMDLVFAALNVIPQSLDHWCIHSRSTIIRGNHNSPHLIYKDVQKVFFTVFLFYMFHLKSQFFLK